MQKSPLCIFFPLIPFNLQKIRANSSLSRLFAPFPTSIPTPSALIVPFLFFVQDYTYQLDSTSEWGYVRRVLLPLLTPTLLIGMLLGISNYFLMFRDVYALYGSNPPARLYMLQHFMNGNFYQLNHQLLSAAALATVLLITGTVWFGKRCTVEKTENGKGRRQ